MPKKEKRGLLILIIGAAVIIAIMVMIMGKKEEKEVSGNAGEVSEVKEEFVQVLEDGTRLNTSTKLHETKTVGGLEISNFQLTERGNETVLLGTITNKTSSNKGNFLADIKIIDKYGKEIARIEDYYIPPVGAGQSTQLNSSATFDYANAYDFIITESE